MKDKIREIIGQSGLFIGLQELWEGHDSLLIEYSKDLAEKMLKLLIDELEGMKGKTGYVEWQGKRITYGWNDETISDIQEKLK